MAALPSVISSDTKAGITPLGMDPTTRSTNYLSMLESWDVIRTVYEGTIAMRRAGKKFLPQHTRESDDEYNRRLQSTSLTNVLRDTIQNTASRPFRKRVQLAEQSPQMCKDWSENVDLQGHSLHMVAIRGFRESMLDGMFHIITDMQTVAKGTSKGEETARRVRPYWTVIPARDLIAAYARYNDVGEKIVYHARIYNCFTRLNGFQEELVEQVRTYRLVEAGELNPVDWPGYENYAGAVWELWEKMPGAWTLIDGGPMLKAGAVPWDRVPLRTFYAGTDIDDFHCTPPFVDIAHLNVIHWQSSSDQRNILTVARFPMLAASGIQDTKDLTNDKGELAIGPRAALITPDAQGKWYFVETTGAAITAGREDLKQLIEDMRIMGLDPLMPQNTGAQTATEHAIDESKARAPLEQWAWEYADFIAKCFDDMCEWVGAADQVGASKVQLDTDIGLGTQKDQDLSILLQLRQMRDISRHSLYEELKRRALLGPYFDPVAEQQHLDDEAAEALDRGFDPQTGALLPPPEPAGAGMAMAA
jgi:hypothetical protein